MEASNAKETAAAVSTEALLKHQTLDIVHSINAGDPHTPLDRYATPDYTYENTEDNGRVLHLNAVDMLGLRELYYREISPQVFAEVLSTEVHIDWATGHATVWVGLLVHNDARGVLREKMNIFFWRLEERRREGERWVWWKEHTSAGFAHC